MVIERITEVETEQDIESELDFGTAAMLGV